MALSGGQRANNRPVRAAWYRIYHSRIQDGLETCRACGADGSDWRGILTFDHLMPNSAGHALSFTNASILCLRCQRKKGKNLWPWLRSLAAEECEGNPHERYGLAATAESARQNVEQLGRMSEQDVFADEVLAVLVAAHPGALTAEEIADALPGRAAAATAKAAKVLRRSGLAVNTSEEVSVPVPATWAATDISRAGQCRASMRRDQSERHAEIVRVITGDAPIDPAWLVKVEIVRDETFGVA